MGTLPKMDRVTEETFESVLHYFNKSPSIDFRDVAFMDPYGMVGVLEIGKTYVDRSQTKAFLLPESEELLRYLERMDFFEFARRYFRVQPPRQRLPERHPRSSFSDVLLEITAVEKSDDIHFIVGKVKERSQAILTAHLRYARGR